jgi:hypothetical protein
MKTYLYPNVGAINLRHEEYYASQSDEIGNILCVWAWCLTIYFSGGHKYIGFDAVVDRIMGMD